MYFYTFAGESSVQCIVIGSTKGGSGKTTLATNLSIAFATMNYKTLLVDADEQASSISWFLSRENNNLLQAVTMIEPALHKRIPTISGIDIIVVDVGGKDTEVLRSAIAAANLFLLPISASVYDAWAAEDTIKILEAAQKVGAKFIPRIILNQAVANTIMLRDTLSSLDNMNIPQCSTIIHQRQSFKNSAPAGKSVIETEPRGKAAQEIKALALELRSLFH